MSNVLETLKPVTHDLGNFEVHRVLPQKQRAMVGPFIFVDAFGPAQLPVGKDLGVRPHPHIGLATVTYLFEGAIDHRDSLGTFQTIRPGEVNLMTAGRGIVHSERTPESEMAVGAKLFGMQTWLALPDHLEETDPAFENIGADELPMISDGAVQARIIMGEAWGEAAPTTCHSPTVYADVHFTGAGQMPIDSDADERALLLVDGEAALDGVPLDSHILYVLKPGTKPVLSSATGGRLMLLGGADFTSPRHIWWNFAASTNERIQQAAKDWNEGRFPKVPGDEEEFIPIPDVPLTRART